MLDDVPYLGAGLGFRQEIKDGILESEAAIDFLELITDQYIDMPPQKEVEARELARRFPVVLHGVELSIGTASPIEPKYLESIAEVASWVDPKWVSDHLSFTQVSGLNLGQLTPLCFNDETADIVVDNVREVTTMFDRPFLLENISYYFRVPGATLTEAEFITRVITGSDCWLLLDLTNVQNNAVNNGYDAYEFLDEIPLDRVVQMHLAGGRRAGELLLDTHSDPIPAEVFDLLRYAAPRTPLLKGVSIERDQDFPPIGELCAELDTIRTVLAEAGVGRPEGAPSG
jgi:uncharacterized protein (UPF0276 family)